MARALSMNDIRTRAARFAIEWADVPGDERQEAQSFVRDLLGVYGITATRAAYYEKRTLRASTRTRGYIDALLPGLAVIEMKSSGADLIAAERQALDYLDDLDDAEMPRWVITSDFRRIRLLDIEAQKDEPLEFNLAELHDHADRLAWLAGYGTRAFGSKEQERASIEAAQLMAGLYEGLEGSGYDEHESSVFLVRLLFALYGDDAGLWDRDLLLEFLETRTAEDGSDLGPQLTMLFQAMNQEPRRRQSNLDELIQRFPYVNGGIPSATGVSQNREVGPYWELQATAWSVSCWGAPVWYFPRDGARDTFLRISSTVTSLAPVLFRLQQPQGGWPGHDVGSGGQELRPSRMEPISGTRDRNGSSTGTCGARPREWRVTNTPTTRETTARARVVASRPPIVSASLRTTSTSR